MNSDEWNARYSTTELLWSADPNRFLAEVAGPLPAGRALDLACGEGRNAIWLAERGWQATGVDFSDVALEKAARLATARSVGVEWVCADVVAFEPEQQAFDLVAVCYLHLDADSMATVLDHASGAVAPGGLLLVVGHARANLTAGVGGPQDPGVLYEPSDIAARVGGLEIVRSEHVTRAVPTPDGDRTAIDTLVVARRPAATG